MTSDERRFYEAAVAGTRRSAPAALRNREPISEVLAEWLSDAVCVLEIASGTGEHSCWFAQRFPKITWQPSDIHPQAMASITAACRDAALPNLRDPVIIDASDEGWPDSACEVLMPQANVAQSAYSAVLCINMAHISPWTASLGLIRGSARLLPIGGALILYGPWLKRGVPTAPSNLAFDRELRERDPEWGLRTVEDFEDQAKQHGFALEEVRNMPANNLMLLFRRK